MATTAMDVHTPQSSSSSSIFTMHNSAPASASTSPTNFTSSTPLGQIQPQRDIHAAQNMWTARASTLSEGWYDKGKGKIPSPQPLPVTYDSTSQLLGSTAGSSSAMSTPVSGNKHSPAFGAERSSVSPGNPSIVSNAPMSVPLADSQFPYAGFLQAVPPDLGQAPLTSSYLDPQSSYHPSMPTPPYSNPHRPRSDALHSHRNHPYGQPSKDDIIRRHTMPRSYWDDPSPEQEPQRPSLTAVASESSNQGSKENLASQSKRGGQKRRQKYTRTRTGCLCCRARRIKCDEGRPVCKRCVIAKKSCQYPDIIEETRSNPRGSKSRQNSEEESDHSEDDGKKPTGGNKARETLPSGETLDLSLSQVATSDTVNPVQTGYGFDASFVGDYGLATGENAELLPNNANVSVSGADPLMGNWNLTGAADKPEWAPDQGGAPMLATPNFLLPWFPTAEERSLILHYCANAASLMMAIPSGLNPMLAINLPLALDSPRGVNASADALRVALLGTGAIHQAFLLARSGVATAQTGAMFQYASTLRDTGKEMVRRAVREDGGALSDAALGAGTALATIDIFFGGGSWKENFNLAKEMVALRGGPAEMLKKSQPTKLTEGVTVSPARLMLEILAIYETFSCLTTGEEPSLLGEQWENWWLEGSRSTYEEHSVEKQFGMSRIMVLLFARLTRLVSRAAKSTVVLTEADTALPNPAASTPTGLAALGADPLLIEARRMNLDVDAWIESLQLSTLEHERVQVGNRAYAHAMKIILLRMVFKYPREDARVQNAAQQVLQHCSWSTAALGMSIDLTWPAIIAGSCVDGSAREWLTTLLEGFKAQCCFDIDTASRIISEVWRRVDNNEPRADWKPVCDDLALQVLLC